MHVIYSLTWNSDSKWLVQTTIPFLQHITAKITRLQPSNFCSDMHAAYFWTIIMDL